MSRTLFKQPVLYKTGWLDLYGDATTYLQNYLSWFMVLEQIKGKLDKVRGFSIAALVSTSAWSIFKKLALNQI